MLSLNLTLTIKFLISLTRTLVPKQLNLRRRRRRGRGNSISSSLPRHGARIKEQEHTAKKWEKETNKTKGRLQVSTKNIEQEELYDA